jgi:dTDP-4-dehydrorhamnose 3,5-epimerase
VKIAELPISGSWVFEPTVFPDLRGVFAAPFQATAFRDAVGHDLRVAQTNHSVSSRGALRGLHFSDTPPGQAKYVFCPRGSLLDVVVDVRVGSPTFGEHSAVQLDSEQCRAVYLSEGLGHAFVALEDDTVMSYLCSTEYNPAAERGISPLDQALQLPWPPGLAPILSPKDTDAPTLAEAAEQGILPSWDACARWYRTLRDE